MDREMPVVVRLQYSSILILYKQYVHFMCKETSYQSAHFNSRIYTFFYQLFVQEVYLKGTLQPQSTYIYRVLRSVWRLPNYWPPPPPPLNQASVSSPRTKGGEIHTRRAARGVGVNISEDTRHWIGRLQYNPSTSPLSSHSNWGAKVGSFDPYRQTRKVLFKKLEISLENNFVLKPSHTVPVWYVFLKPCKRPSDSSNIKFLHFFLFWGGQFRPTWSKTGSGSADPIYCGLNTDPKYWVRWEESFYHVWDQRWK